MRICSTHEGNFIYSPFIKSHLKEQFAFFSVIRMPENANLLTTVMLCNTFLLRNTTNFEFSDNQFARHLRDLNK